MDLEFASDYKHNRKKYSLQMHSTILNSCGLGIATVTLFTVECDDWQEWRPLPGNALCYEYRIGTYMSKRKFLFFYGGQAKVEFRKKTQIVFLTSLLCPTSKQGNVLFLGTFYFYNLS